MMLRDALMQAADACDSLMVKDLNSAERCAVILGYLVGYIGEREVFMRVYNQKPEEAAAQLESVDDVTKQRLKSYLPEQTSIADVKDHLETGYKTKLHIVE